MVRTAVDDVNRHDETRRELTHKPSILHRIKSKSGMVCASPVCAHRPAFKEQKAPMCKQSGPQLHHLAAADML